MRMTRTVALSTILGASLAGATAASADAPTAAAVAVGPQYDTTHVYVAPDDFDRFVASLIATFGGTKSQQGVFQVTPTPSRTMSQLVFTPAGTISVFGFKTPIPYPFGSERTEYLVTDMDAAVRSAKAHDADVLVAPFPDPIGRDAVIEWPGGVRMQLYRHTAAPSYAALQTVPENRVYVSPERVGAFVRDFQAFSQGKVVADDRQAPGVEIGRPNEMFRRIRIDSPFGKVIVLVADGHLPFPYGREIMGYEVGNLSATLAKAKAAAATVLVEPYTADRRQAAIVQFPGGYIAEIHSPASS
jgi:predicted enzyme related to lactoylglutathione lyase